MRTLFNVVAAATVVMATVGCGPSAKDVTVDAEAAWNWAEGEAAGDVNVFSYELPLVGPKAVDASSPHVTRAADIAAADEVAGDIHWLQRGERPDPAKPTWQHFTRATGCAWCIVADRFFADPELVKQSRAWNCVRVELPPTDQSATPYDVFLSPPLREHLPHVVYRRWEASGCPPTVTAYAQRLYRNWFVAMDRPLPR